MFQRVTEILKGVFVNLVASMVMLAVSLSVSWGTAVLVNNYHIVSHLSYPISILSFALAFAFMYYSWRRFDKHRPHFKRLHSDYEVLEKEVTYIYIDRMHHRYTKRLRIRTIAHRLYSILDKYNWTGKGSIRIKSMIPEIRIVSRGKRNIWSLYSIDFPVPLRRKEEREIYVRWELVDAEGAFCPFISQTVDVPTKRLILSLHVPESFEITEASWTVRPTVDLLETVESGKIPVRDGVCKWEISNPKLLHCYELSWYDHDAAVLSGEFSCEISDSPTLGQIGADLRTREGIYDC